MAGDVGPDGPPLYDEFNLIRSSGNYGWPFVQGDVPYDVNGKPGNPQAPLNTQANNTGKRVLPPARNPTLQYQGSGENNLGFPKTDFDDTPDAGRSPAAGPIYYYNPRLASAHKLPPYFDGKWFLFEIRKRWIKTVTLDTAGNFLSMQDHFAALVFGSGFTKMTDMKLGPDGTLYILEYGSPTDYTAGTQGAVHQLLYNPPTPGCLPTSIQAGSSRWREPSTPWQGWYMHPGSGRLALPPGARGLSLYDTRGSRLWNSSGSLADQADVELPASLPQGLYFWKAVP
jgi:hypothetical protein